METTLEPKKKRAIVQTIADGSGRRYYIPARKKRVFKNNLVLRFCISGTIPSKKNCQVPEGNKKKMETLLRRHKGKPVTEELIEAVLAIKPYIRSSVRYKNWEDRCREDLVLQAARWKTSYPEISFPITKATISIYHYWADPQSRDNSNKAESIHDTLVACGILSNDDHKCLYKTAAEADLYKGEINHHLTIFTITAHEW